jgi:pyruvate dehydrogenase E2 component (dihydrolipoamide acetyltransferase)
LLRFKRLDGASEALTTIRTANFSGGQHEILRGRIKELADTPVQVIWGAEDRIVPARHAEGLPPTVRTHVLGGAGHMPHLEKASEVSRLLLELIE